MDRNKIRSPDNGPQINVWILHNVAKHVPPAPKAAERGGPSCLGVNKEFAKMAKTIALRIALVMIVPLAATAGTTLLAYNPAAHAAFCTGVN